MKFIETPAFSRVMVKVDWALEPWLWCLIGGRAVEHWSNPPQTPDVDILAQVRDSDIGALRARMSRKGIELEDSFVGLGSPMLFFKDFKEDVEVDVLGAYDPLHRQIIINAVMMENVPVATAEDVVMLKAQAAASEGRAKDKSARDKKAILELAKARDLNTEYIRDTLHGFGWTWEFKYLKRLGVV